MEELEMDYLKEKVADRLAKENPYRNRREDLFALEEQICGLCHTFELISSEQEAELRRPVMEAMERLDSSRMILV